jgi:hypothetical protein
MKNTLYAEFSSETYKGRAPIDSRPRATGGRGYLRNISLLSVWAHAPFMHNNAVGPELCGGKWDHGSYLDGRKAECRKFDPSFKGRFELFVDSSRELLTPSSQRIKRAMLTTEPVELELLPTFWRGNYEKGKNQSISIRFREGFNSQLISSFRHKEFAADLQVYLRETKGLSDVQLANFQPSDAFRQSLNGRFGPDLASEVLRNMAETSRSFLRAGLKGDIVELDRNRFNFYLRTYTNCYEEADNLGHDFGTKLNDQDKNDLIAFMALL